MNLINGHGRKYNFENDIVGLFFDIIAHSRPSLIRNNWMPAIRGYAEHCGVTETQIAQAMQALVRFCELTTREGHDFRTTWVNAGLDKVEGPALLVLFTQIGFSTTAAFHDKARRVVEAAQKIPDLSAIAETIGRAVHSVSGPTASANARRQIETNSAISNIQAARRIELES